MNINQVLTLVLTLGLNQFRSDLTPDLTPELIYFSSEPLSHVTNKRLTVNRAMTASDTETSADIYWPCPVLLPVLGGAGGIWPAPGHCIGGMLTHRHTNTITMSCTLQTSVIMHIPHAKQHAICFQCSLSVCNNDNFRKPWPTKFTLVCRYTRSQEQTGWSTTVNHQPVHLCISTNDFDHIWSRHDRDLLTSECNTFILPPTQLSGWICLHGVLD